MKPSNKKADVYEIINNIILEKLEQGKLPWTARWTDFGPPRNYVSKKPYRGINNILLSNLGYEYPLYLTFKQAKDLGGRIRKGAKAVPVIYWKILKYDNSSNQENAASQDKTSIKTIPLLRYYSVFNITDVEGITPKLPDRHIPNNPIETCEQIVSGMPNRPNLKHGGDQPYYNTQDDYVQMPTINNFDESERYYTTLFHELSHSTGHQSRLNRDGITKPTLFGSRAYSFEELVAEISACFLSNEAGIAYANFDNSVGYIQGWLANLIQTFKEDKSCFIKASAKAQQAADYILNRLQPTEDEDTEFAPPTTEAAIAIS